MLKKLLFSSLLFLGSCLYSEENLLFYKETEHFQAYCLPQDTEATDNVLQDFEQYYQKCVQDFHYLPLSSKKIKLYLYPDISTFHATLNENNLSDWKVGGYSSIDNIISLVNPKNPGTVHSAETVMKSGRYALGCFFIYKKCPLCSLWLSCGLATYEAKTYSKEHLKKNLLDNKGEIVMPSFSKIDEQKGGFPSRSYPIAAYAYVDFLVTNWGWDKALALLDNYSNFELILQMSEEEFQKLCVQYYQKTLFLD